jgi:RimJ/RimL family protein N-acetyltransferase
MGYGLFAIEEKETGRFVGEVGLGDFRRDLGPDFDGVPEAAWTIARWAQGHGYATEAAAAAHAWMEVRVNATRTVCIIHPSNESSLRVAAKLGYVPFGERSYRGYSVLMLERGWPITASRKVPAKSAESRPAKNGRKLSLGPIVALMELCGASRRRLADN